MYLWLDRCSSPPLKKKPQQLASITSYNCVNRSWDTVNYVLVFEEKIRLSNPRHKLTSISTIYLKKFSLHNCQCVYLCVSPHVCDCWMSCSRNSHIIHFGFRTALVSLFSFLGRKNTGIQAYLVKGEVFHFLSRCPLVDLLPFYFYWCSFPLQLPKNKGLFEEWWGGRLKSYWALHGLKTSHFSILRQHITNKCNLAVFGFQ
jgi:hypothetical protein